MKEKTKKSPKKFFAAKNPLLLFYYGALCLALSLVGQYLGKSAGNYPENGQIFSLLSGAGQLSFLLFGVFLYRLHTASSMREEKRAALLYFGRFAAAVGFLVTVREHPIWTVFWSVLLLFCLVLLAVDAHMRGEKAWFLCLPAALTAVLHLFFR